MKSILNSFAVAALLIIARIRLALSDAGANRLAKILAHLLTYAIPSRRRIAARNIRRAFGDSMSEKDRDRLLLEAYQHAVLNFSDMLVLFRKDVGKFVEHIRVEGLENLEEARARGHGVIAVSAHYGAFPMIAAPLIARNVSFRFLYRRPKDAKIAAFFDRWIARVGYNLIEDSPRHLAGIKCLQALSGGGVICILIDQHFPAGVQVPFFGYPSKTGIGVALLAARSQAPLLPIVLVRTGANTHTLKIEPPLAPPASRSREDLVACMAKLTKRVESWIRADPSQWFWIHRRWKDLDKQEDSDRAG